MKQRSIHEIAEDVYNDWHFGDTAEGAALNVDACGGYLDAMLALDRLDDCHEAGADPRACVVGFLATCGDAWQTDTAKRVRAELAAILQTEGDKAT